jgi:hypothetical protein
MAVHKLQLPEPKVEFDVPPPAQAAGFSGALPLPVGEVMKPVMYTDAEKAVLQKVGVKEGDPIPVDMAERLAAVQAGTAADKGALNVPINQPPLKMPKAVTMDSLDELHQADIRKALLEAKALSEALATEPAHAVKADQIIEVKNDLPPVEALKAEPKAEDPPANASGTDIPLTPGVCPHCAWDLTVRDIPDPDEDTRLWYLQALLGNVPFEKTFSYLNGNVEMTFKELSVGQSDWVYQQVSKEMKDRQDSTIDQFLELVRRYRLCMQLKSLRAGKDLYDIPNDSENPPLPQLFEVITNNVLKTVTLANLASQSMDRFNRLVSKLEACADRENFWPAA